MIDDIWGAMGTIILVFLIILFLTVQALPNSVEGQVDELIVARKRSGDAYVISLEDGQYLAIGGGLPKVIVEGSCYRFGTGMFSKVYNLIERIECEEEE